MRRQIKKEKQKVDQRRAPVKKTTLVATMSVKSFFEEPVAEKMVLQAKSPEWRLATLGV